MATPSYLTPTQRYAAGALFTFALHQAQIHQTHPLRLSSQEEESKEERTSSVSSADPDLWVHESSGLLPPIFRFLEIDSAAWSGLQESAATSPASHHVGAFLRLLAEEGGRDGKDASENSDQELALSKGIDAMASSMEKDHKSSQSKMEKHREYENECREKFSTAEVKENIEAAHGKLGTSQEKRSTAVVKQKTEEADEHLEKLMEKCSTADVKQKIEEVDSQLENLHGSVHCPNARFVVG